LQRTNLEKGSFYFISRLKDELKQKDVKLEESLSLLKSKHTSELQDLAEHLQDVEVSRQQLLSEISALKEREEELRRDITQEQEDTVETLRRKWEREQNLLEEDYYKVCGDRDSVS
jgi:predicted  nucleic acid-binding Zn-ribbon protein